MKFFLSLLTFIRIVHTVTLFFLVLPPSPSPSLPLSPSPPPPWQLFENGKTKADFGPEDERPCMLFLDSLNMHYAERIWLYLRS